VNGRLTAIRKSFIERVSSIQSLGERGLSMHFVIASLEEVGKTMLVGDTGGGWFGMYSYAADMGGVLGPYCSTAPLLLLLVGGTEICMHIRYRELVCTYSCSQGY
jgi:hypothetical protein